MDLPSEPVMAEPATDTPQANSNLRLALEAWLLGVLGISFYIVSSQVADRFGVNTSEFLKLYGVAWPILIALAFVATVITLARIGRPAVDAALRVGRFTWLIVPVIYLGSSLLVLLTGWQLAKVPAVGASVLFVASVPVVASRAILVTGIGTKRLAAAGLVLASSMTYFFIDASYYHISRDHVGPEVLWFLVHPQGLETGLDVTTASMIPYLAVLIALLAASFWPLLWPAIRRPASAWKPRPLPLLAYFGLMLLVYNVAIEWPTSSAFSELPDVVPIDLTIMPDKQPDRVRAFEQHLRSQLTNLQLFKRVQRIEQTYRATWPSLRQDRRWDVIIVCSEGIRFDAINEEVTPNLARLAERTERWSPHFAAASGSDPSVFGLLQGVPAFHQRPMTLRKVPGLLGSRLLAEGWDACAVSQSVLKYRGWQDTIFTGWRLIPRAGSDDVETAHVVIEELARARKANRPILLYWHPIAPHYRYMFRPEDVRFEPYLDLNGSISPAYLRSNVQLLRNRYLNSLVHVDRAIGLLIDALDKSDAWSRSIVVVTSDHGQEFLETGRLFHSTAANRYQDEVPLLFWHPGLLKAGTRRKRSFTMHSDVPAEILSLLSDETLRPFGTRREGNVHDFAIGMIGYSDRIWYRPRAWPGALVSGKLARSGFRVEDLHGVDQLDEDGLARLAEQMARHIEVVFPENP